MALAVETDPAQLGDARNVTSAENGTKGGRPKAPLHADTAERYANEALRDEGSRLLVRHWHGQWYAFRGNGWREIADIEIQGRLVTWLQNDEDLRSHANANYAASAMLNLRSHNICGLTESVEKPCWLDTGESARNWVAFRNGKVINVWRYAETLAKGETPGHECVRDLSPDFFSSDFVDYDWDPDCYAERFHAYIDRVQPAVDNAVAIGEMMGLLMADSTRYEVFWQLYGGGSNGKTVLLDIIKAMVGSHNVSFVTLPALIETFGAWPVAESKVNICGELPTDTGRGSLYAIEGEFKNCVSGGEIEYQKKNRDKYPAKCRARFVMATNSLPTFVDKSDGIWRRLRIIPFNEQITDEEKDVNLAEKIIREEMPGVLAWALDGLAKIIRQGGVSDSESGRRAKDEHRAGCDHERQFMDENYTRGGTNDRIKSTDLYEAYKAWMNANGYRALGAGKFKARVLDMFPLSAFKSMMVGLDNVMAVDCLRKKTGVFVSDDIPDA
jgi:P4 family phage/plasmid primase-like protien